MDESTIKQVMAAMGRKGGHASGKARMKKMTPEERSAVAKKAGLASGKARAKKARKKSAR